MKKEPYQTQERQLAFALMCAGGQFAADVDDGPATNVYSRGFLQQSRFDPIFTDPKTGRRRTVIDSKTKKERAMTIEDAAKILIARCIPGIVTYYFVRNAVFYEFIKAWDGITEALQDADQKGERPELPTISATVTAQVMCIAANNMAIFKTVPFMNKARQMVSTVTGSSRHSPILNPKAGQEGQPAELPGKKYTVDGMGKAWTIDAEDIKEHLKVTI